MISLLSKIFGKGRTFKVLFNISPMYRRTGGRLKVVSDDLKYVKVKIALNYKTKNYVGTIYGGHMYSCLDGIYMIQLIQLLGNDYVVWDKSASIRFKRPANKHLFAEFSLSDDFILHIKSEVLEKSEKDFLLTVFLKDENGTVYAEVEKTIYIANKAFYKSKRQLKNTKGK